MVSRLPLFVLTALSPFALAGCMQADGPSRYDGPGGPPARVTGEPVSCIRTTAFNNTRVRDDRTIDFMRDARQGWRNTLPQDCPGLAVRDGFTYRTSTTQLCSVDIIHVLENGGRGLRPGIGCGLGRFVPIELEPR